MLLFIDSLIKGDFASLKVKLAIVGIMWLFVLISIIVDLKSGYTKAGQRGDARTSYGLKRTVSKFTLYYSCLLFAFMIDAIIMYLITSFSAPVPSIPYVTVIGSAYLIYIEARSVMEKAEQKEKARFNKSLSDLLSIIDNRDDILKAVSGIIRKSAEKENTVNGTDK